MKKLLRSLPMAAAFAMASPSMAQEVPQCGTSGVALQLLGSGGPISDDARASSGAIIWINGKARILIDAGGGNFAVHADAYGRKASDYSIPSYPYLFDPTKPFNGRQPNSAMQAAARTCATASRVLGLRTSISSASRISTRITAPICPRS